jgi:hypothetical protein
MIFMCLFNSENPTRSMISIRLSVFGEKTWLTLDVFSWIFIFGILNTICWHLPILVKLRNRMLKIIDVIQITWYNAEMLCSLSCKNLRPKEQVTTSAPRLLRTGTGKWISRALRDKYRSAEISLFTGEQEIRYPEVFDISERNRRTATESGERGDDLKVTKSPRDKQRNCLLSWDYL